MTTGVAQVAFDGAHLVQPRLGVGRYLLNLCESLILWQPEIRLHILFPGGMELDTRVRELFASQMVEPHECPPLPAFRILWENLTLPRAIRRQVPREALYHSVSYVLPHGLTNRAIVTLHDISFEAHPEWYSTIARLQLIPFSRLAARRARVIVTDSDFSRSEIEHFYPGHAGKIAVIPLAPDPVFSTEPDADISDALIDLPSDDFVVLFVRDVWSHGAG